MVANPPRTHWMDVCREALDLRALADARTAWRFALWIVLATLACALASIGFAMLSPLVHEAVNNAPEPIREMAPALQKRFVLDWVGALRALVVAPVGETILVALGATLARDHGWSARKTVLVNGTVFGLAHAFNGLLLVAPAAAAFMIFTASYWRWRRVSLGLALLAAALPHALMNGGIVALKLAMA
jgi:membrane protease YdiL (CAAX protease family)